MTRLSGPHAARASAAVAAAHYAAAAANAAAARSWRRSVVVAVAMAAVVAAAVVSPVAACPHSCSGHGTCTYIGDTCNCFADWTGADCSLRTCPKATAWFDYASATDTAHALAECSNAGICDRSTGLCKCHTAFEGPDCSRAKCPNDCNGHGYCVTMEQNARYKDDRGFLYSNTYTTYWDAYKMAGCVCDDGFTGYDCSLRTCIAGDDPVTTGQVDEIQEIYCDCTGCSGYFTITYKGETTRPIAYNAVVAASSETSTVTTTGIGRGESVESKLEALRGITGVTVTVSPAGSVCQAGGATTRVTFTQNSGNLPSMAVNNFLAGSSTPTLTIYANGAGTSVDGTKEAQECNGRGTCDRSTGVCACFDGYTSSNGQGATGTLDDCGYISVAQSTCPGGCRAHGICSGATNYQCSCNEGFTNWDCFHRVCPTGVAWFDEPTATDTAHAFAECSNRGICNRGTGVCTCQEGFEGAACDRLSCPKTEGGTCAGNGRCLSISAAAPLKTVNGELNGVHEVQTITCTMSSGYFTLIFRGVATNTITYSSTAAQVKAALELLPTIGIVTVSTGASATACAAGSVDMKITFITEHGDVPAITAISSTGSGISATSTETTKGTLVTYGVTRTTATWDAHMIQGCVCTAGDHYNSSTSAGDPGTYVNYDCSGRTCATGHDPRSTTSPLPEIQAITCSATSGTFTISFRQSTSAAIPYTATADQLRIALESMDTIGRVSVSASSTVCASVASVTFLTELGDLPSMTGTASSGQSITVAQTQAGVNTNSECAGRGMCDRVLGICKCFSGYVSSDGYNNEGNRGDCGHADVLYKEV